MFEVLLFYFILFYCFYFTKFYPVFNSAVVANFFISSFVANDFSFKPDSLTKVFAVIFTSSNLFVTYYNQLFWNINLKYILFLRHNLLFFTKSLTTGISFSTAVRASVVTKLVILSILLLTSLILALRKALVDKLVILGISSEYLWSYHHIQSF